MKKWLAILECMFYICFMRIAYTYFPHFLYQVECLRNPDLEGIPVIVRGIQGHVDVVADCSPEAAAEGVPPGLTVEEASDRCPDAVVISQSGSFEVAWQKIILVLERLTAKIEVEGIGCAYLDLGVIEKGRHDERGLGRHVIETIEESLGLTARVGIGNSRFVAKEAALCAWDCLVIAPGGERDFLSFTSVEALPITDGEKKQLGLLGLTTAKKIASCSREALVSRFGIRGGLISDLTRGTADIVPIPLHRHRIHQKEESRDSNPSVTPVSLKRFFEELPRGMLATAGMGG
jgi:nucleotidyltransferase/DNA polymerase involved in DNA repair